MEINKNNRPTLREASPEEKILDAVFVYRFTGMMGEHNYFCSICREKKAVLNCNTGVLEPCWYCKKQGYVTGKLPKYIRWFLK